MYLIYTNNQYEGLQSVLGYTEDEDEAKTIVVSIRNAVVKYSEEIEAIQKRIFDETEEKFNQLHPELKDVDFYQLKDATIRERVATEYHGIKGEVINALPVDMQLALTYEGSNTIEYTEVNKLHPNELSRIC